MYVNPRVLSDLPRWWLFWACLLSWQQVQAQPAALKIDYVNAVNTACKVGRLNVTSTELVAWQGQCVGGYASGRGVAQWSTAGKPTLRYEGTFEKGLIEGKGTMTSAAGDAYEGQYHAGRRHGYGVYKSADGSRYEGEYQNNARQGRGTLIGPGDKRTAGIFRDGKLVSPEATSSVAIAASPKAEPAKAAAVTPPVPESSPRDAQAAAKADAAKSASPAPEPGTGIVDRLKKLIGGADAAHPSAGQADTPSESAARAFYESENSKPISAGVLKIESFKKTNATRRTEEGVQMYSLEYQAELFFPKGNLPQCVDDTHFDIQCFHAQNGGATFLKVGARIVDKGKVVFEKAENGWRAKALQPDR